MDEIIRKSVEKHKKALNELILKQTAIAELAACCIDVLQNKGKILIAGNGGSAADAQHWAAELVGRFKQNRKALPAIALTTDTSILTAVANDFGFEEVFVRQVQALASPGDLLIVVSTSGNSKNLIKAVDYAHDNNIKTAGFLGRDGGMLLSKVDLALVISLEDTPAIQQMHSLAGHIICEAIEAKFSE